MCPIEHLRRPLIVPIPGERPAGHPVTEQSVWGTAGLALGSALCGAWAGRLTWASWGSDHPPPTMGASASPPSRCPDTAARTVDGRLRVPVWSVGGGGVDLDTQLHDPKLRSLVLNPSLLVLSLPHLCSRKPASFITDPQCEGTGCPLLALAEPPPHPSWSPSCLLPPPPPPICGGPFSQIP